MPTFKREENSGPKGEIFSDRPPAAKTKESTPSLSLIDMALEILQETHDGTDLAPEHLYLLQCAANSSGFPDCFSEAAEVAYYELYASVKKGYTKPWYQGIENMTRDHEGYIYWKGVRVEHYSFHDANEASKAAHDLERQCKLIEGRAEQPTMGTVLRSWTK